MSVERPLRFRDRRTGAVRLLREPDAPPTHRQLAWLVKRGLNENEAPATKGEAFEWIRSVTDAELDAGRRKLREILETAT